MIVLHRAMTPGRIAFKQRSGGPSRSPNTLK
jgi:hypothetical protein